jgi:hypothetical protein
MSRYWHTNVQYYKGILHTSVLLLWFKITPDPSRGVHVVEKAHGRSRSIRLKYKRRLIDLSWLTREGIVNKRRFCVKPLRNMMPWQKCRTSTNHQRTKTRLRKISMKKTSKMRLLEWTCMDAEISDKCNFRRLAKIKLKRTHGIRPKPFG